MGCRAIDGSSDCVTLIHCLGVHLFFSLNQVMCHLCISLGCKSFLNGSPVTRYILTVETICGDFSDCTSEAADVYHLSC